MFGMNEFGIPSAFQVWHLMFQRTVLNFVPKIFGTNTRTLHFWQMSFADEQQQSVWGFRQYYFTLSIRDSQSCWG
jgi:hypothetical protein